MRVLLDTHAFLWFVHEPGRLSADARQSIARAEGLHLSVASGWELAIKSNLGRLRLGMPVDVLLAKAVEIDDLILLPIEPAHLRQVEGMHRHRHRDPFDRLLVAQAQVEGLAVVSNDAMLDQYGVQRIW